MARNISISEKAKGKQAIKALSSLGYIGFTEEKCNIYLKKQSTKQCLPSPDFMSARLGGDRAQPGADITQIYETNLIRNNVKEYC